MSKDSNYLSKIRNIGNIAHIDAGKTTTTERMLYHAGKIKIIREVHDKEEGKGATMDYLEEERERGITIISAATTFPWKNGQINLIDTPGHVDFTAEVERSLRVLDGAIVILDSKKGVEAQTETVWRQANKYKIPRLVFLNKMDGVDNVNSRFVACCKSLQENLDAQLLLCQIPVGEYQGVEGIINLVEEKTYYFEGDWEETHRIAEIPPSYQEKVKIEREKLIEEIIKYDKELGFKYLSEGSLSITEIKTLIRKAVLSMEKFAVFCGSAYKHMGVKLLLDGVIDYLPSPADRSEIQIFSPSEEKNLENKKNTIKEIKTKITELEESLNNLNLALSNQKIKKEATDQALQTVKFEMEEKLIELSKRLQKEEQTQTINCLDSSLPYLALAFKITKLSFGGKLTFIRIYCGKISVGSRIYNVNKKKIEIVSRLVRIHANEHERIDEVKAGDIVAIIGLKHTTTGDTLCDEEQAVLLEPITFAEPVVSQAIEIKSEKDQDKLSKGLNTLRDEDPTFLYKIDQETRQIIISGMGELHLEVAVNRLKNEFGVEVKVGKPQIAYRETIKEEYEIDEKTQEKIYKKVKIHHLHKKQTGGAGQRAEIYLEFEPNPGKGFEFVDALRGEKLGQGNKFVPAVKKGLEDVFSAGPLLKRPVVDVKITLTDGAWHPVDSSDLAFKNAAENAFRENIAKFNLTLLEPIASLEVSNVPKDCYGKVSASIVSRRGEIKNSEEEKGSYLLSAEIPLAETFGYTATLRSLTVGKAVPLLQFSHYREVPSWLVEKVSEKK